MTNPYDTVKKQRKDAEYAELQERWDREKDTKQDWISYAMQNDFTYEQATFLYDNVVTKRNP